MPEAPAIVPSPDSLPYGIAPPAFRLPAATWSAP